MGGGVYEPSNPKRGLSAKPKKNEREFTLAEGRLRHPRTVPAGQLRGPLARAEFCVVTCIVLPWTL